MRLLLVWVLNAIALLGVDEAVAPEALGEIATLPQIRQAKALTF